MTKLIRMYPPPGAENVTYGMRRVGPEGVDMKEAEALLHESRGWGRTPPPKPEGKKKPTAKPETKSEAVSLSAAPDEAKQAPAKKGKED